LFAHIAGIDYPLSVTMTNWTDGAPTATIAQVGGYFAAVPSHSLQNDAAVTLNAVNTCEIGLLR
jgi:hypothetical protein